MPFYKSAAFFFSGKKIISLEELVKELKYNREKNVIRSGNIVVFALSLLFFVCLFY